MRRILEQCMVKLQLKIDYNYRGENLEFGSLGFYLHIHAYCRVHRHASARRCTVYLDYAQRFYSFFKNDVNSRDNDFPFTGKTKRKIRLVLYFLCENSSYSPMRNGIHVF